jgi:hypothetical protein
MADQTYNRLDIATEQLDDAISLLERKRFASALTLAGTAEEILGKMLSHRGQQSFLDCAFLDLGPIRATLYQMSLSKKDFIRDENRALIAVTRMASTSEPSVTLDLENAAHSMIVRALHNHEQLGLTRTARMLEFRNLHCEYVIQALRDAAEGQTSQTAECCDIERASTNGDSGAK